MSEEEWRDIPGYEGCYQVSSAGRVRSLERVVQSRPGVFRKVPGRVMHSQVGKDGYKRFALARNGKYKYFSCHGIVALAFLGPRPPGMNVCHNDGDGSNNAVSNLRYDTQSSNILDSIKHGTHAEGSKSHCDSGHLLDGENLRTRTLRNGRTGRVCRACKRMDSRIERARKRDAKLNPQEKSVIEELRREREAAMIAAGRNT